MSYSVSFKCDNCGVNYMIHDNMELPPLWFATQVSISNSYGMIPTPERDVFKHFCSQECLTKYTKGNDLKNRKAIVDKYDVSYQGEDPTDQNDQNDMPDDDEAV